VTVISRGRFARKGEGREREKSRSVAQLADAGMFAWSTIGRAAKLVYVKLFIKFQRKVNSRIVRAEWMDAREEEKLRRT